MPARSTSVPRLTVLMPVYNGAQFVREAVESILGQTFKDFEFLIINDCSTDQTPEIIKSYHDPRIRVVDNPKNLGLNRSLNKGLAIAKGELIARQDADDISEPERLEKEVEFLQAHPDVPVVGTQGWEIDQTGKRLNAIPVPVGSMAIHWQMLFGLNALIHPAVLIRRAVIKDEFGGYNPQYLGAQDYDVWSRMAFRYPLANLPDCLVRYRIHAKSVGHQLSDVTIKEAREIRSRNMRLLVPSLTDGDMETLQQLKYVQWVVTPAFREAAALWTRLCDAFLEKSPATRAFPEESAKWRTGVYESILSEVVRKGTAQRIMMDLVGAHRRVALFPCGKYTQWLFPLIEGYVPASAVIVLDDGLKQEINQHGFRCCPSASASGQFDKGVLASNYVTPGLKARAKELFGENLLPVEWP